MPNSKMIAIDELPKSLPVNHDKIYNPKLHNILNSDAVTKFRGLV
ncbi:hypothetical protein [Nostoc sp. FACHB-280]|nr:hypothetical protein [Nostoc sp. FACHB-280]